MCCPPRTTSKVLRRTLFLTTLLVVFVSAVVIVVVATKKEACHELVRQPVAIQYLATKRPYHYEAPSSSSKTYAHGSSSCSPVRLWYFGRHGTRYPGKQDIEKMQNLLPRLFDEIVAREAHSTLCPSALSYFKSWQPNPSLNTSTEAYLHPQGISELKSIASRLVSRYPHLFPPTFSNDSYTFRFTKAQRTNASGMAFASEIFGEHNLSTVYFPKAVAKDPLIKFYSNCDKWDEDVDNVPVIELDRFMDSKLMNETVRGISARVGLSRILSRDEVVIMYTTCAFETAWKGGSTLSPWCAAFSERDLAVMEYAEDLEYYWKDGYGHRVNWEQACIVFSDAVKFFDEYVSSNGTANKKVTAYFSHSGATLKMLARLGLFKDEHELRADNFERHFKQGYRWRTSRVDFMGTNVLFVLGRCNNNLDFYVELYVQEKPIGFPGCGGKPRCSYREFRTWIGQFTGDNCDFEQICRGSRR